MSVPKVVIADRMGCLKGGVVAYVVVPAPDSVRFATHYRFRPDCCEAADVESKGMVENLGPVPITEFEKPESRLTRLLPEHVSSRARSPPTVQVRDSLVDPKATASR